MVAQLRIIHHVALIPVPLRDDVLHLSDECLACARDSLAGRLEPLLCLAHERGLHAACRHELSRAGSDVVAGDDELLGGVAAADDAVGSLDEHVSRGGHCFGGADEAFCPAVVLLIEGGAGGGAAAFTHNLLL